MENRIFTIKEAESLLPRLRSLLGDIDAEWERLRRLSPAVKRARENSPLDGFSPAGAEYVECVWRLMSLIQQIKGLGVLLKDAEQGLCDFPYMRGGRLVYLCWKLGEDRIRYWHDIDAGFAGREPLDETDE